MSKSKASTFISFLQSYGPWDNNRSQIEEHVADNAKRLNIPEFLFVKPIEKFVPSIQETLNSNQSQILLICGRAGDGKTHFLKQMFKRSDLLNLGEDEFKKFKQLKYGLIQYSVQDAANPTHFNLMLVSDLSQIEGTESEALYGSIIETLEKQFLESTGVKEQAPNLLVIAGNNGVLVQKLHGLYQSLQEFIDVHSLDSDDESFELFNNHLTLGSYRRILANVKEILQSFKRVVVENKTEHIPGVVVCSLINSVNSEVLAEIFDAVLNHKEWEQCSSCSNCDDCPILRNRQILSFPWVQERIQQILDLIQRDGKYITIRIVLSYIVNALLGYGYGFKSSPKDNFLTCRKVLVNLGKDDWLAKSNVYNNLLGLNFNDAKRLNSTIFQFLDSLKIGLESNQQIDKFILQDESLSNFALDLRNTFMRRFDCFNLDQKLAESHDKMMNTEADKDRLKTSSSVDSDDQKNFILNLQAMRRLMFFNMGANLSILSFPSSDANVNADAVKCSESPQEVSLESKFNPYAMTYFSHAKEFFELYSLYEKGDSSDVKNQDVAKNMILALNRLFCGMYTSADDSNLFIPLKRISGFRLLYNENVFKVQANTYGMGRSINLKFIPSRKLPVLQFVDEVKSGGTDQLANDLKLSVSATRPSVELVITPYMFECLMQLAQGIASQSLPQFAIHELFAFKNQILALLEPSITEVYEHNKVKGVLSSIKRIEVESGGSFILRNNLH